MSPKIPGMVTLFCGTRYVNLRAAEGIDHCWIGQEISKRGKISPRAALVSKAHVFEASYEYRAA